ETVRDWQPRMVANAALACLLQACLADLDAPGEDPGEPGAAPPAVPLVEALVCLALIDRGVMRPGSRRGQSALRTARLSRARRLILAHLQDPALSPAMVAERLGVSVRHLHVLFET
ncbi:AraC family transcriptional regulator, partial [Escherichia coli]|nr:AraC family transcriptional regulator [Escherichia coli]